MHSQLTLAAVSTHRLDLYRAAEEARRASAPPNSAIEARGRRLRLVIDAPARLSRALVGLRSETAMPSPQLAAADGPAYDAPQS
jgi:hypothetical protein